MPYFVPEFNLTCNIKVNGVGLAPVVPGPPWRLTSVPCALVYGRRVNTASTGGTQSEGVPISLMSLLLPKLTDVRGPQDTIRADFVECPAGSGRFYYVVGVDDIGKGYANEHRTASVIASRGLWLAPYA